VKGSYDLELHRYLRRMLGSTQAADDVAQDTYARLGIAEGTPLSRALLFDVATKVAMTRLLGKPATTRRTESDAAEINDSHRSAREHELHAAIHRVAGHLRRIIKELSPKHRMVFVFHYVHQLPFTDIARLLNISAETAQERATGALAECRSKFTALDIDPLPLA
jgi:RNA polymerase sigma factor (sigma-70 family)